MCALVLIPMKDLEEVVSRRVWEGLALEDRGGLGSSFEALRVQGLK